MTEDTSQPRNNTPATPNLSRTRLIAWTFTVLITAGFILWLYYPALIHTVAPVATPTQVLTSPTLWPTRTPTAALTPTLRPTLTPTSPASSSAFFLEDLSLVSPALPGAVGSGFILDEKTAVEAVPDFSSPAWISSSTISGQLGYEISEPFYATFGAASVTWKMDDSLPSGIYDIYVLDTVFSSGGTLDFRVYNDDLEIYPYLGTRQVVYQSMRGSPPQQDDIWHSIGTYNLDKEGIVSISSSWDTRDENTIVAVDRVMIIPRPAVTYTILSKLPLGKQIYILDDPNSRIENSSTTIQLDDGIAWNGAAEVIINPDDTLRVTWSMQDAIPIGRYVVWVWVPELNGTAQVKYRMLVNEDLVTPVDGTDAGPVVHGGRIGGQWIPIGEWEVGLFYSPAARLSLIMEAVTGATTGEIAVDAVAFIQQ